MGVEAWVWSAEWCKRMALATVRRMGYRRPGEGAGRPVRMMMLGQMTFSWTRTLPGDLEDVDEFKKHARAGTKKSGEERGRDKQEERLPGLACETG